MTGAAEGSNEWIGTLYDRYAAGLYRYALMILADTNAASDAVQQVFLKLTRRRLAVDDGERYLRRAIRNECFSVLRTRRQERARVDAGPLLEPVDLQSDRPDERLALERALKELPADQREVLHLRVFEGMTSQEIANLTGESLNTIASRYRYALEKMRKTLQQNNG